MDPLTFQLNDDTFIYKIKKIQSNSKTIKRHINESTFMISSGNGIFMVYR